MLVERLENGLEVVLLENRFSRAVALQAWVGVGSIDETFDQRGMAHFVEHMLFKGTPTFGVGQIAACIEGWGGDINAYTTFDRTVYYLTLGSRYGEKGIEILSDALRNSLFDPSEVENERQVILDEIRRYKDDPGALVAEEVFRLSYPETEAGRPIIGSSESVSSISRDALWGFYKTWYQPSNIRIVAVGDFDTATYLKYLKHYFDALWQAQQPITRKPVAIPQSSKQAFKVLRGDYEQARIDLVFPGPSIDDPEHVILDLAAFILGAGETSRINRSVRDEKGLITHCSCSVYSPKFLGLFEVSALPVGDDCLSAVKALAEEMAALVEGRTLVDQNELRRARANFEADRRYRDETVDGQARSLGFSVSTPYGAHYEAISIAIADGCDEPELRRVAKRWLKPDSVKVVAMVPMQSDLQTGDLESAFNEGWATGSHRKAQSRPKLEDTDRKSDIVETLLGDGISFFYRQNPRGRVFSMTMVTHGGLRLEKPANAGYFHALAQMLGLGCAGMPAQVFLDRVEGCGASLDGFSGKDSLGLSLNCLTGDWQPMLTLMCRNFLSPEFSKPHWDNMMRSVLESLRSEDDSPGNICSRKFQELLFKNHSYRWPMYGTKDAVNKRQFADLEAFPSFRDSSKWVFSAVGSQSFEEVRDVLVHGLAGWQTQPKEKGGNARLASQNEACTVRLKKSREQAHIMVGYPGLTWTDPRRPALDVLANILGGQGGRLFLNLRDRDGIAYSVAPLLSYGVDGGAMAAYLACSPDNASQGEESLILEMDRLACETVEVQELERAKGFITGNHDLEIQRAETQVMSMALMGLYGCGAHDFLTYSARIASVTAEEVRSIAKDLFAEDKRVAVVVSP